jgi:hypothetical protein
LKLFSASSYCDWYTSAWIESKKMGIVDMKRVYSSERMLGSMPRFGLSRYFDYSILEVKKK